MASTRGVVIGILKDVAEVPFMIMPGKTLLARAPADQGFVASKVVRIEVGDGFGDELRFWI